VQECDDGRDRGQDQDVILEQPGNRIGFGGNDRPLGFRCQQDVLDARDELVEIHDVTLPAVMAGRHHTQVGRLQ
jgi:hypothetical protein